MKKITFTIIIAAFCAFTSLAQDQVSSRLGAQGAQTTTATSQQQTGEMKTKTVKNKTKAGGKKHVTKTKSSSAGSDMNTSNGQ